jgi:hypothetical protein
MAKVTADITKIKEKRNLEAEQKRLEAYRIESDPLFFKAQRGEIELQEWTDKVQEIKQRFPKL